MTPRCSLWLRIAVAFGILGLVLGTSGCFGPPVRPVVDFSWCPDGSEGRLDYWFTSTASTVPGAAIVREVWDFGDGSPTVSAAWDALHRFDSEGTYRVTLTVTDSRGVAGTWTKDVSVAPAVFVHSTWRLTLGYPPAVSGIVESRSEDRLNTVVVRVRFYDADGVRVTDGSFEILDLEPGEKAAFEVRAQEFAARVFYATVAIESFDADCGRFARKTERVGE